MKKLLSLLLALALLIPAAAMAEETTPYTFGPFTINVREGDHVNVNEDNRIFSLYPADSDDSLSIVWGEGDHIEGTYLWRQTFDDFVQHTLDYVSRQPENVPESVTLYESEYDSKIDMVTLMYSYDRDMGKYYASTAELVASLYEEFGKPNPYEALAAENEGVMKTIIEKEVTMYIDGDGTYFFSIHYDAPEDGSTSAAAAYLDEILAAYFAD